MSLKINFPQKSEKKEFKQVDYVKFVTGVPVRVRVLHEDVVDVNKHFIPGKNISVVCPGSDCPICARNQRLYKENPGAKYNEIKGIIPKQTRYLVNVLNRTLVKKDSLGNIIYPLPGDGTRFPPTSVQGGGEIIVNIQPTPLNEVQVLERGSKLFNQILEKDASVTDGDTVYKFDDEGNLLIVDGQPVVERLPQPVGILNYDLILTPSGAGQLMEIHVTARPDLNDEVTVTPEQLHDLNTMGIRLTGVEIDKVMAGVSLKDIFAARKVNNSVSTGETTKEAENRVSNLFETDMEF